MLNDDPEAANASIGWQGDFGVVIDDRGVFIGRPVKGRLPEPQFMQSEALEELAPDYYAKASSEVWWKLIEGELDPIAAIVQKQLVARGDLAPVVARLAYRGLAERWLQQLRRGG